MTDSPHLIALDLDGTLLRNNFLREDGMLEPLVDSIDADVTAALTQLHNKGHQVVLATGRSVDATTPIIKKLGIPAKWAVSANGAITLRRNPQNSDNYIRHHTESFNPNAALLKLREDLDNINYGVELTDGTFLFTEEIPSVTLPTGKHLVPFEKLLNVQATRVVVFSRVHETEDFHNRIAALGLSEVSYSVGRTAWLDIAPAGVTKASALQRILEHENIPPQNIFAAGDGRNDIAMLEWAGRHGNSVAMGQAPPEVKQAAKQTTGEVNTGGLITALREHFPKELQHNTR